MKADRKHKTQKNGGVRRSGSSKSVGTTKRSRAMDDFVMTISDSDEDVTGLDEDEEDVPSAGEELVSTSSSSPEPTSMRCKKRKRRAEEEVAERPENSGRKRNDGGLDPNFEFQAGAFGESTVELEGWGFEGAKSAMKDSMKSVDIDEIIRRRMEKNGDNEESRGEAASVDEADQADLGSERYDSESEEESKSDEKDTDLEFTGFDEDDEDVAADAFGMGADSSENEEETEGGTSSDDSEACADSDNESIASPVPHPDDEVSSESDSEAEDATEAAQKAAYFAPEPETSADASAITSFQSMNLSRPILRGLASLGFNVPTMIQRKTIPVALLGKDVVGGAVTGSGKTAAFIVPILERLIYRPKKHPTSRVLILCPTRELAIQCHEVARRLAQYTDVQFGLAVGGLSLKVQEAELRKRPDVIIATPGRFIDHMRNSQGFVVDTIEIIVMDEADRMLEDGFADELNEIIATIPISRQTMLFSATMTDSVDKLIGLSLNRPVRIMVDNKKSTVKTLVQEFVRIRPQREKLRLAMLVHICKEFVTSRCIVFFRSKAFAHRVRVIFGLFGLKAAELHGSLTQEQRIKAVEFFRNGQVEFLLATDLASRGLDIPNVSVVVNYEAPQSHDIYLHRVGRTARAGRAGCAITLAAEGDRKVVKAALKASQSQGLKVISRVLDNNAVDQVGAKITSLENEVDEVLKDEKDEKAIQQMEMQVRKGENLIKHGEEIMSRPKRTWFETQREKKKRQKISKAELNGVVLPPKKEGKSGKKRKRELNREEGMGRKKRREDRGSKLPKAGGKAAKKNGNKKNANTKSLARKGKQGKRRLR